MILNSLIPGRRGDLAVGRRFGENVNTSRIFKIR